MLRKLRTGAIFNKGINVAFKKGNKFGKGGKRPGAGRPTDKFKAAMKKIVEDAETIKFVRDVVRGKAVERYLDRESGTNFEIEPTCDTRLEFIKFSADRGLGKVSQPVEHSGSITLEDLVAGSREGTE